MNDQQPAPDKRTAGGGTVAVSRPLCVDLDGTLILTDSLVEAAVRDFRRNPLSPLRYPFWLAGGKARLKAQIAQRVQLEPQHLPYNQTLLRRLRQEKESGRKLVLATAAHEGIATAVAEHLNLFDEVHASDAGTNLKGERKRQRLVDRFGDGGYDYVGDGSVDLSVWKSAHTALLVSGDRSVLQRLQSQNEHVEVIEPEVNRGATAWLKSLRPHQWVKNLLIFLPLLLAHETSDPDKLFLSILKFAAFCLCASGVYLLNDLFDLDADRGHPRKKHRPLASGALPVIAGLLSFPLLFAAAYAISSLVTLEFVLVLTIYVVLTMLYSFRLKRVLMLDVVILASLYTVRIFAGSTAIDVGLSPWLLGFSVFIFLSLAFAKRYSELYRLRLENKERAAGRGYVASDVEAMAMFGAVSGFMSVLVFALYLNSEDVVALYGRPELLWLICPLLIYWIARFWLITHRGQMHEDPVVFALSDRTSFVTAALAALIVILAV